MPDKLKLHQPTPQTHLPAHEQAARQQRAALLHPALAQPTPLPPQPQTPTHWPYAWGADHH